MSDSRTLDAAILGAGIAGSCLAILLARRGWKVALIDRQSFPRHKVCGEFLSPDAVEALVALGLEERLQSLRPAVIRSARLDFGSRNPVNAQLPGAAWGISRYALDAALHDEARLAGADVATGTAVGAVRLWDGGYELDMKRGAAQVSIRSRSVIGAWGGNGRIPDMPGAQRRRLSPCPYVGVKTHLSGIELDGELELYFFAGGYLGLSSAGDGIVNAAALLDQRSFRHVPSTVTGWLEAAGQRNPRLARRIAEARPAGGTQTAVAPVRLFDPPLAWNGIPLIGDACVTIPPLCGDGMSMAIRSAQLCAISADRCLRSQTTQEQWKIEYTKAIDRHFRHPLRWGRLLQRVAGNPSFTILAAAAAGRLPSVVARLVKATRLGKTEVLPW
ncbi:NAD(P)/FAD-dependent oxidoreductase [Paenibacillus sacheonensis]|uniref:NAD(P)-binding protein n=1 Tax=Paenibacillus sacheonensis TaxID=742054 RepID=A0A7X4YM18_9BACL|nr:NAD(P)/FAD-dependent oxidoreductase [Paenibacillus sacheonensis]MBM7565822.1 flavin-dependent dehydrogenase [Paenibacillus sacheonensis]NBC68858.1 NAD(P)-binding protein [Paenibacillus sacheonensis]